jgi:hypothetical protein
VKDHGSDGRPDGKESDKTCQPKEKTKAKRVTNIMLQPKEISFGFLG